MNELFSVRSTSRSAGRVGIWVVRGIRGGSVWVRVRLGLVFLYGDFLVVVKIIPPTGSVTSADYVNFRRHTSKKSPKNHPIPSSSLQ